LTGIKSNQNPNPAKQHLAASAINPAPSGAISYRSRKRLSPIRHILAKWSVKIAECETSASVFLKNFLQPEFRQD
jgi:hypothetical protein